MVLHPQVAPIFGPDLIVTETGFRFQIPGALEGLLIGTPLFFLPIPETPYLFLKHLVTHRNRLSILVYLQAPSRKCLSYLLSPTDCPLTLEFKRVDLGP